MGDKYYLCTSVSHFIITIIPMMAMIYIYIYVCCTATKLLFQEIPEYNFLYKSPPAALDRLPPLYP